MNKKKSFSYTIKNITNDKINYNYLILKTSYILSTFILCFSNSLHLHPLDHELFTSPSVFHFSLYLHSPCIPISQFFSHLDFFHVPTKIFINIFLFYKKI